MRFLTRQSFLIITGCLVLGSGIAPTYAADSEQALKDAAIAYEKVVPVEGMITSMIDEMKRNPQIQAFSSEDYDALLKTYDMDAIRSALMTAMVKHFTVEEMDAMTAFYSTNAGQSVLKKMPAYTTDFMPYIQQQTIKGLQQVMVEKKQKKQDSQTVEKQPEAETAE